MDIYVLISVLSVMYSWILCTGNFFACFYSQTTNFRLLTWALTLTAATQYKSYLSYFSYLTNLCKAAEHLPDTYGLINVLNAVF